ncbi:2OG-Fe dioxygenase family protein [Actinomadura sp. 9N215]|uniref:2OG-Fe dioxygenase family protein n=1 Tax=Actinomadura sp. 9N215 TaxID=3375150 RepID=UPI0037B3DC54
MTRQDADVRSAEKDAPSAGSAGRKLREDGWFIWSSETLFERIGATEKTWSRFADNWDDLTLDTHMGDGGVYRYRRYGRFGYDADTEELTRISHHSYFQEADVNPLNGGVVRHFDPLTDAFDKDPLLEPLVRTLGEIISAAEGVRRWYVELHPVRIVTGNGQLGKPTPQGVHRDGVTYVATLVTRRTNITGGKSSVYTDDRECQQSLTLQPGDFMTFDDRRMLHHVTPVEPIDEGAPASRDVLIVDFTLPDAGHAARNGLADPNAQG